MSQTAAWAATCVMLLGTLLAGGCSTCGSGWGAPPAAYPSGYGPATGAVGATTAPPANYGQPLTTDPGWRAAPAGTLSPSGAAPISP